MDRDTARPAGSAWKAFGMQVVLTQHVVEHDANMQGTTYPEPSPFDVVMEATIPFGVCTR